MQNDFEFKYSAPITEERKEIESIRNSYSVHSESNKLMRLRELDAKVKNVPTVVSLVVGIIGLLVFGLGLTMILEWKLLVWGIIVSALGFVLMCGALPINKKLSSTLKAKYSDEIIKLSDELLNEK